MTRPLDTTMWAQKDLEALIEENTALRRRVYELEQQLAAVCLAKEIEVTTLTIMMSKTDPVADIQRRIAELAERGIQPVVEQQSTIDERLLRSVRTG